ncbi:MAG TPA: hypothetical protein VN026_11515 [Bacteroidia bacterium]|nr:hypothetical protein [Bacteroidia bacterium]
MVKQITINMLESMLKTQAVRVDALQDKINSLTPKALDGFVKPLINNQQQFMIENYTMVLDIEKQVLEELKIQLKDINKQ